MSLTKYEGKGLTGLANLGNTCYINSCMQILSHCYLLNDFLDLLDVGKLNKVSESLLLKEWKDLKDLMWANNCTISPNRFLHCIQHISQEKNIELFSGFAQNDLPEFLLFLVDCFHNSLKRKVKMNIVGQVENKRDVLAKQCFNVIKEMYSETYSELLSMFYGIHVSLLVKENKTTIVSIKPEPFSVINLPLPEGRAECSITYCFDLYTADEFLSGENAWYNEETKAKEEVYKTLKFWNLPDILIIDLKRFNNQNRKITTLVNTPLIGLVLSKYVVGYDKETFVYDLFGICNHMGSSLGGHYTAYVKNANNKWYHFNDTNVDEIAVDNLITNKAYSLFYKKCVKE